MFGVLRSGRSGRAGRAGSGYFQKFPGFISRDAHISRVFPFIWAQGSDFSLWSAMDVYRWANGPIKRGLDALDEVGRGLEMDHN